MLVGLYFYNSWSSRLFPRRARRSPMMHWSARPACTHPSLFLIMRVPSHGRLYCLDELESHKFLNFWLHGGVVLNKFTTAHLNGFWNRRCILTHTFWLGLIGCIVEQQFVWPLTWWWCHDTRHGILNPKRLIRTHHGRILLCSEWRDYNIIEGISISVDMKKVSDDF